MRAKKKARRAAGQLALDESERHAIARCHCGQRASEFKLDSETLHFDPQPVALIGCLAGTSILAWGRTHRTARDERQRYAEDNLPAWRRGLSSGNPVRAVQLASRLDTGLCGRIESRRCRCGLNAPRVRRAARFRSYPSHSGRSYSSSYSLTTQSQSPHIPIWHVADRRLKFVAREPPRANRAPHRRHRDFLFSCGSASSAPIARVQNEHPFVGIATTRSPGPRTQTA